MVQMKITTIRNCAQHDLAFLYAANSERENSQDPKSKISPNSAVGAIIVQNGTIVSRSSNVFPAKLRDVYRYREISNQNRYHYIEHAERAAILNALIDGKSIAGSTIYCTRFPCSDCARSIIWAGIERLVVGSLNDTEGKWAESQSAALSMLEDAGIDIQAILGIET